MSSWDFSSVHITLKVQFAHILHCGKLVDSEKLVDGLWYQCNTYMGDINTGCWFFTIKWAFFKIIRCLSVTGLYWQIILSQSANSVIIQLLRFQPWLEAFNIWYLPKRPRSWPSQIRENTLFNHFCYNKSKFSTWIVFR